MTLNDREYVVVVTKAMGLSEKQALAYLKGVGFEMSIPTYYRILGVLDAQSLERLFEVAKNFKTLHLNRLDKFKVIEKEMWIQYHRENDAIKKVSILSAIANIQPYISQLEEITQEILEENAVEQTKRILSEA